MKSFTSASGKITVPISRPSNTAPPVRRAKRRWNSTNSARTSGRAATLDAAWATVSLRSSRPFRSSARNCWAACNGSAPFNTCAPTARYNNPVSKCAMPKCFAIARLIEPFPAAAGPSMAINKLMGFPRRYRPAWSTQNLLLGPVAIHQQFHSNRLYLQKKYAQPF